MDTSQFDKVISGVDKVTGDVDDTKLSVAQRKQQNNDAKQQATVGDGKRPKTFSYTKDLQKPPTPSFNGVNPWSLIINVIDTIDYSKGMLVQGADMNGKPMTMGDKYFVPSGICHATKSDAACRGKTRYMYIDNVPSRVMPCANPEMPSDPKCQQNPTGLIAGVVQDAVKMNPFELVASVQGKGSYVNDKCVMRTERVGYEKAGVSNYRYETKCAPPRKPLVCSVQVSDGPKCAVFTMTNAQKNNDTFAKSGTGVLATMVKKTQDYALEFITDVRAKPVPETDETGTPPAKAVIDPPKQTRSLPLDPYDRTWTTFCSKSLNGQLTFYYNRATQSGYTTVSTTRHCLMDRIQCERKWVKYRWYSFVKINTSPPMYYQIEFYAYILPKKRYNNFWLDDATQVTGKMDAQGQMYKEAKLLPRYTANVEFEGFMGGDAAVAKEGRGGWWDAVLLLLVVLLVVGRGVWRRIVGHG